MTNAREMIKLVEKPFLRDDLPILEIGDTIKMRIKVDLFLLSNILSSNSFV